MSISRTSRWLAGAALVACLATPVLAQDDEVVTRGPDMGDVARTPLDILNIDPKDIPPVLAEAVANPYASDELAGCADIGVELNRLTRVLGADFDNLVQMQEGLTPEKAAQGALGMLIPFDGIIREITGAAKRERDLELAITAGFTRRGYLKGLGYSQGCLIPARPISTASKISKPEADQED